MKKPHDRVLTLMRLRGSAGDDTSVKRCACVQKVHEQLRIDTHTDNIKQR